MEKIEKKADPVKGVIFIDKQSIFFYFEKAKGIYKIDLKPEIVFDLEVVNEDLLSQTINQFLTASAIPPLAAIIILSPNVLFMKDFSRLKDNKEIPSEEYEDSIKKFTDNVPFEDPEEKRYPISKTSEKVVVLNMNYIDVIKHILSLHHITISSVNTPFDKELGSFVNGYSDAGMRNALGKIGSVKTASVESQEKKDAREDAEKDEEKYQIEDKQTPGKKITPATIRLLAVFGVLILILVGVSIKTFVFDTNDPSTMPTPPTPDPAISGSSQNPPTPTIIPEIAAKDSITIQIINATGINQEASKLSDLLEEQGYVAITTSNTSPSEGARTRIILKSSIDQQIKDEIQQIVGGLDSSTTTIETPELSSDVIITIYNPLSVSPANQPQN